MSRARHTAAALFAAFALAGVASAAPSDTRGVGVVWQKDAAAGTLTIGQQTYHLTPDTELRSADGRAISLERVPVARDIDGALRGVGRATVQYRAVAAEGRLVLDSLELIVRQ